jgi:hypothetical protein
LVVSRGHALKPSRILPGLALALLPATLRAQEATPDTTLALVDRGCCLSDVRDGA